MTRKYGLVLFFLYGVHARFTEADQSRTLPLGLTYGKEFSLNLTNQASLDKLVLAGDGASNAQVMLVSLASNDLSNPVVKTSSALPLVSNSYSPASYDGFNVSVSKGGKDLVSVLDVQGEPSAIRSAGSNGLDKILLSTKEDGNGAYNYNLLFGYNLQSKKIILNSAYLNINNSKCDQSLLTTYRVDTILGVGENLNTFDGAQAFQLLKSAYRMVESNPGSFKKLMPDALEVNLKQALVAFQYRDNEKLKKIISEFIVANEGSSCSPEDYIVMKYFFPDMVGWSNDLGFLFGETGHFAESIVLLKKVVETNPDRVVAWRPQKLSATPDQSGTVCPCPIKNSASKNASRFSWACFKA